MKRTLRTILATAGILAVLTGSALANSHTLDYRRAFVVGSTSDNAARTEIKDYLEEEVDSNKQSYLETKHNPWDDPGRGSMEDNDGGRPLNYEKGIPTEEHYRTPGIHCFDTNGDEIMDRIVNVSDFEGDGVIDAVTESIIGPGYIWINSKKGELENRFDWDLAVVFGPSGDQGDSEIVERVSYHNPEFRSVRTWNLNYSTGLATIDTDGDSYSDLELSFDPKNPYVRDLPSDILNNTNLSGLNIFIE